MRRRKTGLVEAEVNLTPLIDVCFVILVMFIVVAPLLEREKVELATAQPGLSEPASQRANALVIHVLQDNTILVDHQKVALQELKGVLAQHKERRGACPVQLFHDRQAHFGTYQSIKNGLESAGFLEMELILKKS